MAYEKVTKSFSNRDVIEIVNDLRSLLKEKLNSVIKFKISEVLRKFEAPLKSYSDTQKSLVEELGDSTGNIPATKEDGSANPNYKKYIEEVDKLNEATVEVSFMELPFSLLKGFTSESSYHRVFDVVKVDFDVDAYISKLAAEAVKEEGKPKTENPA